MKIFNSPVRENKLNYKNSTFKSATIAPRAQAQIQEVLTNKTSKDLFVKLAGIAGLTGIISWVKAFTSREQAVEKINQLDVIDINWTSKANEKLLDPETTNEYLDIVSRADEAESLIWTKGLLSDAEKFNVEVQEDLNEKVDLFLDEKSNSTLMSVTANKTINSIMTQIKALSNASEDARKEVISRFEQRLNSLVKQADELQNDEKTSEIYTKLTNIARMFALTTLISDKKIEQIKEQLVEVLSPVEIQPDDIVEVEEIVDDTTKEVVGMEKVTIESSDEVATAVVSTDAVEEDSIKIEKPQVKIIGKIDLKEDKSRFRKKEPVTAPEVKEAKVEKAEISEKNEKFVNEIFLKAFMPKSKVKPEIYYPLMDDIKRIYESYDEEKEKSAKLFLKTLANENHFLALDNYIRLNHGKKAKIDFTNFVMIESIKQKNGGSISAEEYQLLDDYKDREVKYYTSRDDKIEVAFNKGISAEKRLAFIRDLYKIAFNKTTDDMHTGLVPEEIKMVDVIDELSYRLAKNNEDYPNILFYLGIDSEELKNLIEDLSQEDAIDEIKDFLSNAKYKTKLESLATILNNEDFDFFIDKTHSRMRIIERFVFDDDKNVAKNVYQLEKKVSSEIKKIKSAIEKVERISFTNYSSTHDDGSNEVVKSGPRVILKDYTFGINDAGQILTIW